MDKVVIIDDSEFDRSMICRAISMKRSDVTFMELSGGENAAEVIATEKPAITILDIRMPGMDGFEVLETIRSREDTAHVPVLMISGSEQAKDRELAEKGGADGYYVKPPTAAAYFSLGRDIYNQYLCDCETETKEECH